MEKSKINESLDKVDRKFSKAYSLLFEKKFGKILFYALGITLILIYLLLFFFKEPIIDEEVQTGSMNNLIPWEIHDGENILNVFTKAFDLKITELGQYRPRYLAFLIQGIEENIFFRLTRAWPAWGNRNPFYPIAAILLVISVAYFIRAVWKKCPRSFAFFIGACIPLYQSFQVATYLRARSAKLFVAATVVFLMGYFFKHLSEVFEKNKWYKLLIAIPIFVLMTLDEQVLALVVALAALGILISIINKKINLNSIIFSISTVIYASYHLFWGKMLFRHFTGELAKHGHAIDTTLETVSFSYILHGFQILFQNVIGKVIFISGIVFIIIWLIFFFMIKKEKSRKSVEHHIVAICLLLLPVAIMTLLICSNNAIWKLPCLRTSVYSMCMGILLFCSLIYVIGKSETKIERIKFFVVLIGIVTALTYNLFHINEYYLNYLDETGGFFVYTSDMDITNEYTFIDYVPEVTMQYSNDSIISSMATFFTGYDFKDAKISKGNLIKDEAGNYYITDEFSCYLITGHNRKLNINAVVENPELYTSLSVYINKLEVASYNINDKNINLEVDVRSERNRAGKVTLVFHKKIVDYDKKMNINLKELYMN